MELDVQRLLLNAIPEPSPAKTKMRTEMNSANAAFRASAWPYSAADPIAILGIVVYLDPEACDRCGSLQH
ncbi:hypothetical protein V2J09_019055 [Rumex salicifolius]